MCAKCTLPTTRDTMCQNPALLLTSAAWTEEVDPFLAVTISRGGNGPCRERQVTDCRKVDYFLFFWFVRTADFQKVRYFWFVEFLRTADESQLLLRCFSACRKRTSATPPPPRRLSPLTDLFRQVAGVEGSSPVTGGSLLRCMIRLLNFTAFAICC